MHGYTVYMNRRTAYMRVMILYTVVNKRYVDTVIV